MEDDAGTLDRVRAFAAKYEILFCDIYQAAFINPREDEHSVN